MERIKRIFYSPDPDVVIDDSQQWLNFVELLHDMAYSASGGAIDMDAFQVWVHKTLPPYSLTTAILTIVLGVLVWFVVFLILHYVICKNFVRCPQYLKFTEKEKMWYASHWHGIVHALFSGFASIWCFHYADGQPHTTWWLDNYFKLTMFDVQKYLNLFSVAFLIYDSIFCTLV